MKAYRKPVTGEYVSTTFAGNHLENPSVVTLYGLQTEGLGFKKDDKTRRPVKLTLEDGYEVATLAWTLLFYAINKLNVSTEYLNCPHLHKDYTNDMCLTCGEPWR